MLRASSLFTKIGFSSRQLASDRKIDCPAVTIHDVKARVRDRVLQGDRSVLAAWAEHREAAHTLRNSLALKPPEARPPTRAASWAGHDCEQSWPISSQAS